MRLPVKKVLQVHLDGYVETKHEQHWHLPMQPSLGTDTRHQLITAAINPSTTGGARRRIAHIIQRLIFCPFCYQPFGTQLHARRERVSEKSH